VVRRWIDALGGHGEVHSTPGQGTRFALTLPVEFGSSPTLVVRVAGQEFGIPISVIDRVVPVVPDAVLDEAMEPTLSHEGRRLPLRDLGAMLGLRGALTPTKGQPVVVVQSEGVRRAIAVDEIVGDRDLVVRAIPIEAAEVGAFQGACTMALGDLLLVLRPGWLARTEIAATADTRRALVVDDSLTARAAHRAMLEAAGYLVHTVSSGTQALEWLGRTRYAVIVCDVGMSPMDGIAFAAELRAREGLRDTPVILVSAREDATLRERGLAGGADAFLSKSRCAAGGLLAEVDSVLERRRA
jgi:two-component system chemotaxis sensor kinase CheA